MTTSLRPQPYIEITKVPEDREAPIEVRKAFVGLKLPVSREHYDERGDIVLRPVYCASSVSDTLGREGIGWKVNIRQALDILSKKDPKAASWLLENLAFLDGNFAFNPDGAMLID